MALKPATIKRMTINFTQEQRDFAEQNFGVRDWPEQFLSHCVSGSDGRAPTTETWWSTMREILRQINVGQMNA
jgi:hypothetical protein